MELIFELGGISDKLAFQYFTQRKLNPIQILLEN